jgi:hypothetical protein
MDFSTPCASDCATGPAAAPGTSLKDCQNALARYAPADYRTNITDARLCAEPPVLNAVTVAM